MGYAVLARMVPLSVVDELLGGTVRVAWCNLHGYVEYERERAGPKEIGNGFSDSPSRSTGIAKPELVSPWARTTLTATGGRDLPSKRSSRFP